MRPWHGTKITRSRRSCTSRFVVMFMAVCETSFPFSFTSRSSVARYRAPKVRRRKTRRNASPSNTCIPRERERERQRDLSHLCFPLVASVRPLQQSANTCGPRCLFFVCILLSLFVCFSPNDVTINDKRDAFDLACRRKISLFFFGGGPVFFDVFLPLSCVVRVCLLLLRHQMLNIHLGRPG